MHNGPYLTCPWPGLKFRLSGFGSTGYSRQILKLPCRSLGSALLSKKEEISRETPRIISEQLPVRSLPICTSSKSERHKRQNTQKSFEAVAPGLPACTSSKSKRPKSLRRQACPPQGLKVPGKRRGARAERLGWVLKNSSVTCE